MDLQILWFCLIALLWAGYFLLEGFDFGVGMLLPFLPKNESERGVLFGSIGPVWDGNEVWLVIAAGATFAAFPAWYATMFSGFYLALLLILFFLIIRVVSFEWREKSDSPRWRALWLVRTRSAATAPRSSGASVSQASSTASRSTETAISPARSGISSMRTRCSRASRSCSSSPSTARSSSRSAPTGDLCERALRAARAARAAGRRRGAALRDLDGLRRGRPERQERVPAGPPCRTRDRRARSSPSSSSSEARRAWPSR